MFTCTKLFSDIPFAHRQHLHDGHCALIHGHNWGFEFTFAADSLDENGFVVDFGKLKWLRDFLNERFDHCLVLNYNDPYLQYLRLAMIAGEPRKEGECTKLAKITTVPNCGAEGLAGYLYEVVSVEIERIPEYQERRLRIHSVVVHEDSKNHATFLAGCGCSE